ncbi:Uncharacterised protein [Klebsiella pneumoniae]|nr:Uncharacterised protein [Klebsiella pneumoniae]
MAVRHFQQRGQRVIRLKREEADIGQSALAGHFFQPRFTTALPDYHEHPRVFAQLKRGVNHALQPLFFADVA